MSGGSWQIAQAVSFAMYYSGALRWYDHRQRRGSGPRCVVLCYHRVTDEPLLYRDIALSTTTFRRQLEYLRGHGYRFLTLAEHHEYLDGSLTLGSDAVVVTFDDGYRDNYECAWPIMRELGLPGALFLTTGPLDGGEPLWWDRTEDAIHALRANTGTPHGSLTERLPHNLAVLARDAADAPEATARRAAARLIDALKAANPETRASAVSRLCEISGCVAAPDRMLTWAMVRTMAECGFTLGCHSVTHPDFAALSPEDTRAEIGAAIEEIERRTGVRPTSFAYPFGKREFIGAETVRMLEDAGIAWAYTTENGVDAPDNVDRMRLRRDGIRDVPAYVLAARMSGVFEDPRLQGLRLWIEGARR